jgi:hypothetical protein
MAASFLGLFHGEGGWASTAAGGGPRQAVRAALLLGWMGMGVAIEGLPQIRSALAAGCSAPLIRVFRVG